MSESELVRGVDVYAGDRVDYRALARAGVKFAYIKVTEGADVDKRCSEHARGFRGEGIEIGGYAYEYSPRDDQAEAARIFADVVGSVGIDDLRPSVDFESACSASRTVCVTLPVALQHAEDLARNIEELLDVENIPYTGPGFWNQIPNAERSFLCSRYLWVADYRGELASEWSPLRAPQVPKGWADYLIHQFTNGKPHGISILDRNLCRDLDLLRWKREPKVVAREFSADQIILSDAAIPPQQETP